MDVLLDNLGTFAEGVATTVELTTLSFLGALAISLVIVTFRVSPVRPLRLFGTAYVEVFQNVPLLLWILFFVFGLPKLGIRFELFTTAVLAVAMYSAAYYAEALRTGINTVAAGQAEAARALGLGFGQSLRWVVLPQALRSVVQPLGNLTVMLLMNTALAAGAGLVELSTAANRVNLVEAEPILIFSGAAVVYALLALLITTATRLLERRLVIHR
ncbi:amino acid ABC transporter permease [Amycolatopsis magusensis]|uniref:Glutamate transport system permease protein n=1 Tax=Amycolatopsis magusensis TaxID=882444 RepID=A0ABS4PLN4_9PSEU|nr:amino acid ABC transporter permease [Amycolatopsis magusensis]MBP2179754.1 glutamate transport system permease protein [Amycolatopsis magusensis]MDI5981270.1 amino acid ABC transporter permease [Amycolatopsis magusensis]UJW34186.1 amino acid ABC transporter permease [Saccharothrix sp. AJ9571]